MRPNIFICSSYFPFLRASFCLTNPLSLAFEKHISRCKSQVSQSIQRTRWLCRHLFVPISSNPLPPSPAYRLPSISAVPFPPPPTTAPSSPSRPASPSSATNASHPRAMSKPLPKNCSDSSTIWR